MKPAQNAATAVSARPQWGMARLKGAVPRIEIQITGLRPQRSPTGPPTSVPTAVAKRKTKRKSCEARIVTPKRSMR